MNSGKQKLWATLTATRTRKRTSILAALATVLIIVALAIGVSDNLLSLALIFIATSLIYIACVYTWRQTKKFLILMGSSLAGFFLFVVLHNVFYGLAITTTDIPVISQFMEFSHVAFFCIAIFACPPGFVIGAAGSIFFHVRKPRDSQLQQDVK